MFAWFDKLVAYLGDLFDGEEEPPGDLPSTSPQNVELHRNARPIVQAALERVLGRSPTPYELQYGHGVAWLESNYGRGWKGPMVGSNNWGAVQCPKGSTGGDCIPYQDSFADGTRYDVSFRRYATPEDGAADALRHVFAKRPRTAAAIAGKGATVYRASFAMRRERYYEGFCPNATKRYGRPAVRASLSKPDSSDATLACQKEAVENHAKRLSSIVRDVAAAAGDTYALPLGTYEDAERWYHETFPDAGPLPGASSPAPSSGSSPASPAAPSSGSSTRSTTGRPPWERFGPAIYDTTPITVRGHTLRVTRVPVNATVNGVVAYPPFSLTDAREYLLLGGEKLGLATAEVLDAMHNQGWYYAYQVGFYDVTKNMDTDHLVLKLGQRWQAIFRTHDYKPSLGPVVNIGKPVIWDAVGLDNPGRCVIRGFYEKGPVDNFKNPVNKRTTAHGVKYRDLSTVGVFVERKTAEGRDYYDLVQSGELGNKPFQLDAFWKAAGL